MPHRLCVQTTGRYMIVCHAITADELDVLICVYGRYRYARFIHLS